MYKRNRIYIPDDEQEKIRKTRILIAGAGLGSNIAECALRLGFENITICDMDRVEASNLNRQNYTWSNIFESKAKSLQLRLKTINPNANIECHNVFLTKENCEQYISKCDIAINTIDYTSNTPIIFDEICLQHDVPVLHPFNLGWAACTFVVTNESENLNSIIVDYKKAETKIVEHILKNGSQDVNLLWLKKALEAFKKEKGKIPPPQLAPASWFTGGLCTNILYKIVTKQHIKSFPDFYLINP
jgi:molybdopterin/thiamine biosynthesis adenylyltransferase